MEATAPPSTGEDCVCHFHLQELVVSSPQPCVHSRTCAAVHILLEQRASAPCPRRVSFFFFYIFYLFVFNRRENLSPLQFSVYLCVPEQTAHIPGTSCLRGPNLRCTGRGEKNANRKKKMLKDFFPPSAWIQELSILSRRVTCWGREQKSSLLLRHTRQGTCLPLVPLRAHPTPEARGGAPETQLSV